VTYLRTTLCPTFPTLPPPYLYSCPSLPPAWLTFPLPALHATCLLHSACLHLPTAPSTH